MVDKRKITRMRLLYYLRVFDADTAELMGEIENFSSGGLLVVGAFAVEAGKEYRLRMKLPPGIFKDREYVFTARSVWSRKDDARDRYRTGFEVGPGQNTDLETIVVLLTGVDIA